MNRQVRHWEKIFEKHVSDNLHAKYTKNSSNSAMRKKKRMTHFKMGIRWRQTPHQRRYTHST